MILHFWKREVLFFQIETIHNPNHAFQFSFYYMYYSKFEPILINPFGIVLTLILSLRESKFERGKVEDTSNSSHSISNYSDRARVKSKNKYLCYLRREAAFPVLLNS